MAIMFTNKINHVGKDEGKFLKSTRQARDLQLAQPYELQCQAIFPNASPKSPINSPEHEDEA